MKKQVPVVEATEKLTFLKFVSVVKLKRHHLVRFERNGAFFFRISYSASFVNVSIRLRFTANMAMV